MSGVCYYFLDFFKVNSGVFLHNRVATLHVTTYASRHTSLPKQPFAFFIFYSAFLMNDQ